MAENGMRENCSVEGGDYTNGHQEHDLNIENGKPAGRLNEAAQKYIQELLAERARMENHFPLAIKLIDEALERVQQNGRIPTREQYADVYQQRAIKITQKVHVPIKDKKFNYVGKLLGPKGNSLRRLQEETQCKIVILGRFSMKDRIREEELRNSAEVKYAHLNLPLHVEISTIAPPAEAYARVAYALAEIRRYLTPDKHDDIRQEQFRELMADPEAAKKITMRQQQQQQQHHHSVGGNNRGGGNNGNGHYRSKYQQQSQYHNNDDPMYYRAHNKIFQPKQYVPNNQRSNPMQPQAIVGGSPTGMVLNTANYSGRGGGMMINNPTGGAVGGAAVPFRVGASVPYQFIKK